MAIAYQSGCTTACYSVSVSACKGLTPATMAIPCYAFTNTEIAKSVKSTFRRNAIAAGTKLFLLKDTANVACTYMPILCSNAGVLLYPAALQIIAVLILPVQKTYQYFLRIDKPVLQVK